MCDVFTLMATNEYYMHVCPARMVRKLSSICSVCTLADQENFLAYQSLTTEGLFGYHLRCKEPHDVGAEGTVITLLLNVSCMILETSQVGEKLPLPDASVDAVVGTLVLCSVSDVSSTLKGNTLTS